MVGEVEKILNSIITEFDLSKFEHFFRQKSDTYTPEDEEIPQYNNDLFSQVTKLGQMQCGTVEVAVIGCKVERNLTERSSKKAQYILGKKILRFLDRYAGGFFIFYDSAGNFRFSFIYSIPQATGRREWSNFRRYTYYVSKDQTNKTFKQQMDAVKFVTIDDIIQAFSVEKVTKEFYQKIANWYFWAIKNVKFPSDAENEPNGREMAVIRLITRIIFIWFMKVRHLIPEQLFDENFISQHLKNYNRNNNDFYKAILQNLFFATLNTRQEDRRFRNNVRGHKGYNPDFGNNSVYRYEDLFKDSKTFIEEYFYPIPFLNGGLFECLDIKLKDNVKYIDGFTDVAKHQPNVPNYLFFTDPDEKIAVDLNKEYGTVNNKYKVEGLFNILKTYNFTIDENSFDDEEVALDPELLGKIFENLLASYNPETAKTARKETGSYYTPREIVDYMVEQSLRYYLKTEINDITDKELDELFTKENDESNNKELFDKNRTKQIIEAIYNLRVVDPAVGSGAFPMGMLHKLVLILDKLDPNNLLWKEMQIEAVRKNVKDPVLINKLVDQIEITFSKKNADYGRKLYLIQKCLYGVDIQPIAIEIAKLRFFISLLVDETIDKNENNYGIEPLPNLDFKLMQGNSLIDNFYGIDVKINLNTSELREEITPIIEKFDELKYNYQYQSDANKKKELLQSIEETLADLFYKYIEITCFDDLEFIKGSFIFKDDKSNEERIKQELDKYYKQKGFDIEKAISELKDYIEFKKPKNFFLWNIFFAEVFNEKGGFDIVIGNPPYIQLQKDSGKLANLYKDKNYSTFTRMGDIYVLFYERGMQLLKEGGILAYITSNKWMRAGYGEKLRQYFTQFNPKVLIDLGPGVFESATVDTNILLIEKQRGDSNWRVQAVTLVRKNNEPISIKEQLATRGTVLTKLTKDAWFIGSSAEQRLKEKIERIGKPLKDWDVKIYRGVLTGLNEAFIITTEKRNEILANCKDEEERKRTEAIIKPILRGRDIKRYYYEWAELWVIVIPAGYTEENRNNQDPENFIDKQYYSLMQHLKQFKNKAQKRDDQGDYWWELRHCAYYHEFEKEKVVYSETIKIYFDGTKNYPRFSFTTKEFYLDKTTFFMSGNNQKYFLGILNSNIGEYLLENGYCIKLGSGSRGLQKILIENIPIPPINNNNELKIKQIEEMVDSIITAKKQNPHADTTPLEREIDQLVYRLYDLTDEEIRIVEGE